MVGCTWGDCNLEKKTRLRGFFYGQIESGKDISGAERGGSLVFGRQQRLTL